MEKIGEVGGSSGGKQEEEMTAAIPRAPSRHLEKERQKLLRIQPSSFFDYGSLARIGPRG